MLSQGELHIRLLREDLASTLTGQGYIVILTIFLLAQVVYLTLHYLVGVCLSILACLVIVIQVIINSRELAAIDRSDYADFSRLYRGHQWLLHTIMLLVIPFMIWAIVLMIQKHASM